MTETPRQTERKKPRERRNKKRQVKKCSMVVPDRQRDQEQQTRREREGGKGRESESWGSDNRERERQRGGKMIPVKDKASQTGGCSRAGEREESGAWAKMGLDLWPVRTSWTGPKPHHPGASRDHSPRQPGLLPTVQSAQESW